jgi:hypothetical protein
VIVRSLLRIAGVVALLLALAAVAFLAQRRLLYFPTRYDLATATGPAHQAGLEPWLDRLLLKLGSVDGRPWYPTRNRGCFAFHEAAPRCQSAPSWSPMQTDFSSSVNLLCAHSCGDLVAGA